MVAFDGSAETALNVLSVALSGSKETVRVVVFPFATVPDVGVTLIALTGVILLRSSATEGLPVSDFHRAGDHFFRRHGLTDTADPATKHIHRAIRKTDFIGPDIAAFKPAYKPFLAFLSRFPGQRKLVSPADFCPCPVAVSPRLHHPGSYHRRILPSSRPASDPSP